jgi:hypothetical protein
VILTALAALASQPDVARMEPLIEVPQASQAEVPQKDISPPIFCTNDKRWCVFMSRDSDTKATTLNIYNGQLAPEISGSQSYPRDVGRYPFVAALNYATLKIWPTIIRYPTLRIDGLKLNETIDVGVISEVSTGYSGGGAQSTSLRLFQLGPTLDGSMPDPTNFGVVLDVPLSGQKLIRACFGDQDYERRRGVCHDAYDFKAILKLGKTLSDGTPQLLYQSYATTTPRGSRLSNDNSALRLSVSDVKPGKDRKCSYRRVYSFDGEFGSYFPPKPPPDCSDYMVE